MSDNQQPMDAKATLAASQEIRELFAAAHDLISKAEHAGYVAQSVARVLAFLQFQYNDFKSRCERLETQIAAEAKALSEASKVDVKAVEAKVEEALGMAPQAAETTREAPKS